MSINEGSKAQILKLAWPIGVSMVSFTLKNFIDMMMVGELGVPQLAGVGFAGIIAWTVASFPFGALRGQRPLVSQYIGAGDQKSAFAFGVHAFYLALFTGLLLLSLAIPVSDLCLWLANTTKMGPEAAAESATYLLIRMQWMWPMLLSLAVSEYLRSQERTRIPMVADLVVHPINVLLNYVLIFGKFGFPEMGVAGAALGTGLADLICLGLLLWMTRPRGNAVKEVIASGLLRPRLHRLKRVLETGWTGGIQFSIEGGSFALITYFVGFLGAIPLAIHQAGIQILHLSILPAIAIADAGSVLVGKFVGEKRYSLVNGTVKNVLQLTLILMGTMAVVFLVFGEQLIGLFINEPDPVLRADALRQGGAVAIALAVWQFGDAYQVTYRFCLRATGDHKWVMWAGIGISWILNVPLIAIAVFWFGGDLFHVWIVFSFEIYVGAWLFHHRWKGEKWKQMRLVQTDSFED